MNWFAQLFCKHKWVVRFKGTYMTGYECTKCHKPDLRREPNDGSGWAG